MSGQVIGSLKHALNGVYSGGTPTAGDDSFYSDDGDPFVTIGDMSSQFPITSTLRRVTPLGVQDKNLRKVKSGTVLVSMYATIGLPNILATDAYINQAILALTPSQNVDSRFLYYWLMHLRPSLVSTVSGSTQGNLNAEKVKNADFPFLELPTQKAIADFLDRETARIDKLIEKKQRLVELLEERINSLVEQVHRLNGVSTKLSFHASFQPGYAFPSSDFTRSSSDIRLLRGVNVTPNGTRWDETVYWPREKLSDALRFALRAGDVVVGMDRPWISSGIRAIKLGPDDVPSLLLQRVCRVTPRSTLDGDFLLLLLKSKRFLAHFEPIMTGVSVPHISGDQIGEFVFQLPTLDVQTAHVRRIGREIADIDLIREKVWRSMGLLNEVRGALISSAVSGSQVIDPELARCADVSMPPMRVKVVQ